LKGVISMYEANKYIHALFNEPFCDLAEEYEELLRDWYGDDISLFDLDDEDLSEALRRLTQIDRFWRTASKPDPSHYEKLRRKYDLLLELYSSLAEDYNNLRNDNRKLAVARTPPGCYSI